MEDAPRILQAKDHTLEVYGGHLISNKFFNIVAMLSTSEAWYGEYPIKSITFSENKPEDKYGEFIPETGAITINLQRHFDATCKNVKSVDDVNAKYLSFRAGLWFDMLITFLHECFHCVARTTDAEGCKAAESDPQRKQAIEEDCTSAAQDTAFELFRDVDCEPCTISEEPFFGVRFMKFFVENIQEAGDDWAVRQSIMIDSEYIYYDEEDKDGLTTMREWLRCCEEGDPDANDERWDAKVRSIPNALVNPAVMVAGATTTREAKEVAVRPEAEVPAVVAVEQTVAVVGEFVQAPDNAAMAELMDEAIENAPVMEMESEVIQSIMMRKTSAEAELAVPNATVVVEPEGGASKKCSGCQADLPEGAKFCMNCATAVDAVATVCAFGGEAIKLNAFPAPQAQPAPTTEFITPQALPVAAPEFITPGTAQPTSQKRWSQSLRNDLPNIGMNVVDMKRILGEVYNRMHTHCFTKCGFQVSGADTGNATAWNAAFAGNVLEPLNITDIPGATDLIIAIDKNNPATGKTIMKHPVGDGYISGKITKGDEPVPSYAIYINNNGIEQKRIFMVQKAFKQTPNGYSVNSLKAQKGNQISWVWDGNDQLQSGGRRWIYKIENGIAEWL